MHRKPGFILIDAATNDDAVSQPLFLEDQLNVRFDIDGGSASNPTGDISVEACENRAQVERDVALGTYGTGGEAAKWKTVTLPEGCAHGTGFTFTAPDTSITWTAAQVLALLLDLDAPFTCMRVRYTSAGGGTASPTTGNGLNVIGSAR